MNCLLSIALVTVLAGEAHAPAALELARPEMTSIAPDVWVAKLAEATWVVSFTHRMDDGTVYPANGLAIDTVEGGVLVDPGWEPPQTEAILRWSRSAFSHPVKEAIITHSHADRSAGIGVLLKAGIPALGLARTAALLKAHGQPTVTVIANLDRRRWKGPGGIEVFFPGPGHAPDNLVVWVPSAKLIYGGCLVKSVTANTLGNVDDADVTHWAAAVRRVQAAYPHASLVVPGHGTLDGDPLGHTLELLPL
jgi:metallo-beta-lactamase class B